ncbi:MAG: FMN-binding glutamate synthase family protein [Flavobacteriales bacterium]
MVRRIFVFLAIAISAAIAVVSIYATPVWWLFFIVGPLILLGFYDMLQDKHAIRKNFPVIGNLRYFFESIRPEIMQYFVETDTEGRPFDRIDRSLVYRRSKNVSDTTPFGTQENTYQAGYEWINHSLYAKSHHDFEVDARVTVGGKDCLQPYSCSVLNISAMSFGSLSSKAVESLNGGARLQNFAHNTGEGGISPYHLNNGGDLIWQVGTGYFGCRGENCTFSPEKFKVTASIPAVKMIEIKLSQGAKPGHGGILPAKKNTEEIAKIRGVEPHTAVNSPPAHSAFSNPMEFMTFIKQVRDFSGGKPVGFKLCVGVKREFEEICEAMVATGITPDYIAVDGGEGGTGAAPVEFSDSVGTPFLDGLAFVHDTLVKYGLREKLKISASGKVVTGFHIVRALAMGADFCQSARAMMMSLGCIQALLCNTNTCPVGIATQDKKLMKGLDVENKTVRVANYHKKTVDSFKEILLAAGITEKEKLTRSHINHRIESNVIKTYEEMYPSMVVEKMGVLN